VLPDHLLSSTPLPAEWLPPDDIERDDMLVDRELGGTGLNNPNDGLMVQAWRAWVDGNDVRIATEAAALLGDPGIVLFSDPGITELSLTFDQNMRPAVAYVAAGMAKLRWYDSVPGAQVTTSFPGVTSPRASLDDKRPKQLGASDVVFVYLRDGEMFERQQRDRFGVERPLGPIPSGTTRIGRLGMSRGLRMQFEFLSDEVVEQGEVTAAHSALLTDTLYAAGGSEVLPLFGGALMGGRWRSRLTAPARGQSFGWIRVNGDLGGAVTLRFYGDDVLVHEITTATRTPTRVPAGRWRRLEIEVESAVRCTTVTLAGSAPELSAT